MYSVEENVLRCVKSVKSMLDMICFISLLQYSVVLGEVAEMKNSRIPSNVRGMSIQ
jgi:hypothetical protein